MNGDVGPHQGAEGVPAPAAHVVTATFVGETVLYDSINCRPILLNVSAAAVWALLDGRRTLMEIVAAVAEGFGAAPALVEADVAATVARFHHLGLLATADHEE
ncbi:MAG: PqqD family protein [Ilumatobacteraceae bacterium]